MKNIDILIFCCLMILAACKSDPALVRIPAVDSTPPTLRWELHNESAMPNAVITEFKESSNITTIHRADKVHLYLVAEDLESGIRHAILTGQFDYLCIDPSAPDQGTNSHGSIPGQTIHLDMLTLQALKEWKLDGNWLLSNFECGAGYDYSKGKFELSGLAINPLKDTSISSLTIQVLP